MALWIHIKTKGGQMVSVAGDTSGKVDARRHTPKYLARCGAAYENYRRERYWFGAVRALGVLSLLSKKEGCGWVGGCRSVASHFSFFF